MPVYYTAWQGIVLNAGDNVSFISKPNAATGSSFQHVIDFFSSSNASPYYSWFAQGGSDCNGNFNGLVNVNIPVNGTYYYRIRPLNPNASGAVYLDYIKNGVSEGIVQAPVAGGRLYVGANYFTPVNYFTCNTTGGNPLMWLEDHTYGAPGKMIAWNNRPIL